ncbi:MAG: hypothetical protein GX218_06665 [Clostridiaceae bacterium]|nr:hypothetical protein [Clostridiaceae bacterium]
MTDEERNIAGRRQLTFYLANQYPMWRVVLVKSIKKILENLDGFYSPIFDELKRYDEEKQSDTVNGEIRNGLFFEALSQSVQAVEDLFSMMKYSGDIPFFAKNVVTYNASKVTRYIRGFDTANTEFLLQQFQVPYLSLNEPWEDTDVFDKYVEAVQLICEYMDALIEHHRTYYFHYCQYKHGMAVALRPFGGSARHGDDILEGVVMTFDNVKFTKRIHTTLPAMMIPDFHTDISKHITALHEEDNLLRAEMKVVNLNLFVGIVEKAYTLLSVLHHNLKMRCEPLKEDNVAEIAFPTRDYKKLMIMGFPTKDS